MWVKIVGAVSEQAASPGKDVTGCRLLCPQSQGCSCLLEPGAGVCGVASVMEQCQGVGTKPRWGGRQDPGER